MKILYPTIDIGTLSILMIRVLLVSVCLPESSARIGKLKKWEPK